MSDIRHAPYKSRASSGTASRKAHAIVNRLKHEHPNEPEWEIMEAFRKIVSEDESLKGLEYPIGQATEDWLCVDCGINTAPGFPDGATMLQEIAAAGSSEHRYGPDTEVYYVRERIWQEAGMEPFGGCLCIGCLEKRLGRRLRPKDFDRTHAFYGIPGTERLLRRQGLWK